MPAQIWRLVQCLGWRSGTDIALALANLAIRPLGTDTHLSTHIYKVRESAGLATLILAPGFRAGATIPFS